MTAKYRVGSGPEPTSRPTRRRASSSASTGPASTRDRHAHLRQASSRATATAERPRRTRSTTSRSRRRRRRRTGDVLVQPNVVPCPDADVDGLGTRRPPLRDRALRQDPRAHARRQRRSADQVITTLGARLTLGITVDPASTPSNVILWVSHSEPVDRTTAQANSSIVSRLSGPGLQRRARTSSPACRARSPTTRSTRSTSGPTASSTSPTAATPEPARRTTPTASSARWRSSRCRPRCSSRT